MKYADIQKLQEAGLITNEQRQKIVEHFQLKEESNRFLVIISFVGAVLVVAGIVLLIAANWNEIPRGMKIAVGLLLMLGAHGGGWYLREARQIYRKTGEALHLIGSGLFLGNIALVGQIYHLVARTPNAFLLWWLGLAALPWLLRSKAHHVLSLLAFGLWFGLEINQADSVIRFDDEHQVLLYALLGLVYVGVGWCCRRTSFAEFASVTEKLGLLLFLMFAYPLTWKGFLSGHSNLPEFSPWILPTLAVLVLLLLALGLKNLTELTRQWRWTWGLALLGGIGLLAGARYLPHDLIFGGPGFGFWEHYTVYNGFAAIALFAFCLLQVQVGLQERSAALVNLGVAFIALIIIAAYLSLFGSMAVTGAMFVVSGVFLIVFGVYLEKKRRSLMRQIKAPVA